MPDRKKFSLRRRAGAKMSCRRDAQNSCETLCNFVRLWNSVKSMSRFCPNLRQALGRAEAGEFGGNGVQAFEDIAIVGFLGRGLFGEERNRAAGFEYGAVDDIE